MTQAHVVGIDWNSVLPFGGLPECTVRINWMRGRDNAALVRAAVAAGHTVYLLIGSEAVPISYTTDYLSWLAALSTEIKIALPSVGPLIFAFTGPNEVNDWKWGTGGMPVERVREVNERLYALGLKYGVPYALTSYLTHDWDGGNNGYDDLYRAFPDRKLPCDLLDIHCYADTVEVLDGQLQDWAAQTLGKFIVVGEFGTLRGENIPVRQMFDKVLATPKVAVGIQFCLQDFPDADKRFGLIRQDGSMKTAFSAFRFLALERANDKYAIGGTTMTLAAPYAFPSLKAPTKPTTMFFLPSAQMFNPYVGGLHQNSEGSAMDWLAKNPILSLLPDQPYDGYCIFPQLELYPSEAATMIPRSVELAAAYARKYPNQRVGLVSFHTDSGLDQHYGSFWLPGSDYLAEYIEAELAKVHGKLYKFSKDMTGQGYFALGQGTSMPPNLFPVLIEIAAHGDKTPASGPCVRWIEDRVDGLAGALVEGAAAWAIAGAPSVDWKALYEAALATAAANRALYEAEKAKVAALTSVCEGMLAELRRVLG